MPQSGLADVISRGRIDSVMYVYFGDKFNDYHKEEIAGRIIQVSSTLTLFDLTRRTIPLLLRKHMNDHLVITKGVVEYQFTY